jgi:hypothetical protein
MRMTVMSYGLSAAVSWTLVYSQGDIPQKLLNDNPKKTR